MTITATRPHTVSHRVALLMDNGLDFLGMYLDAAGHDYHVEDTDYRRDVALTIYHDDDTVTVITGCVADRPARGLRRYDVARYLTTEWDHVGSTPFAAENGLTHDGVLELLDGTRDLPRVA